MNSTSNLAAEDINDLIHGRVRLAAMAYIAGAGDADFTAIKKAVNTSDGNMSVHLRKLEDAGYLAVTKGYNDRKPQTIYALTDKGRAAWDEYLEKMRQLLVET
ncbi:MAG: transcriptional regulator [Halieaceae bacterium]|nr:transcriptional regulator [Halieaceae bacterium]MDG2443309.1 transcriptional regulator [Luminiphilus sp.]|tara:strand:- start:451 stop:759 length:309 start_codon:yes stop_codon:yes gene_type:complete